MNTKQKMYISYLLTKANELGRRKTLLLEKSHALKKQYDAAYKLAAEAERGYRAARTELESAQARV